MEILDRYLQSVKWLLPKEQKEDVVAELSEDFRSQIEEEEAGLGRKLDESEVEAILQRWGHPLLVAQRYAPQQYLIGPALFPVYRFVLKMVALCYLLPWLLVWLFYGIFVPSYRAEHPGLELIGTLQPLLLIAVFAFTVITVGFAVAEKSQIRSGSLERWTPRKVPVARDPDRISRSESIGDMVGDLIFTLWWLDVLRLPSIPEVRFTLTLVWDNLYWPILLLALASVAMAAVNTFRPRWTRLRSALRLGLDAAGLVLMGYLLSAGPWTEVAVPNSDGRELAVHELAKWINLSVAIALGVIGVILILSLVRGIRRLRRPEATLIGAYP
ncbi:MAG TPA: hypothetical protein VN493_10080 [Thermoanaerobaculia bacterium]|nr:hypothetical protein [Thermoanaerobaculia bacterium]